MSGLTLHFQRHGFSPEEFFRISWPEDRPIVWAALTHNIPKVTASIDTDLVIACTPPTHKVYFVAATEYGHDSLKSLLDSSGDFYLENFGDPQEVIMGLARRASGRSLTSSQVRNVNREKWALIGASTRSRDVIGYLFRGYELEYGSVFTFPMMVAKQEPSEWMSHLKKFFVRSGGEVTPSMIEESHCVIVTYWEHGLELMSNKITKPQLTYIAKEVASRHSLSLEIKDS